MNQRERFKRVMRFEAVDRVPFWDYGYWEENLEVWQKEGLPALVTNIEDYWGIEKWAGVPVNIGHWPSFREEVLEEDERTMVVRDDEGQLKRVSKHGSSIPQFIEFPVKSRRDWEKFKAERLDPDSPERYPDDWDTQVAILNAQEMPVFLGIDGYFGFLRRLFGLENLSLMYYDDPGLILDIQEHMTQLRIHVLERALKEVKIDAAFAWEDMAYNTAPHISPAMYRRFMLPFYRRVTSFLADHGIDIVIVDSDGNINELVPLFIESGITAALPFEVRAGNDVLKVREKYPRFGIIGGVDKMQLMRGTREIDAELAKVKKLLPGGGFIPTVDHRVPPDVPYKNYVYYVQEKYRMIHDPASYANA